MNPFEMVVMIVAIVMISSVIKARYQSGDRIPSKRELRRQARYGITSDPQAEAEANGMREEIKQLKERIIVLERVITETNGAAELDREIEKLR